MMIISWPLLLPRRQTCSYLAIITSLTLKCVAGIRIVTPREFSMSWAATTDAR
jgi:hypothetical protein